MEAVCGGGRGRKVALIYAPVKKKEGKERKKETAYSRTLRCSSRHLGGSYDNCV